jgi:serine/threonine-protein kinase
LTTLRDPLKGVQPGDVLGGKFRVERVLGEGGMGVVAAATHLVLGQLVALKFMLPHAMKHKDNLARFEREARAAVRLRSDHVAKVSDVGHLDDGTPYIVMEYLEGEDLDQVIERGVKLPIETAVDYILQACEAVAEAHSLGIVHRDLKPKNLFLTKRLSGKPLVKVLDFGISKSATDDLSLTSTTQTLGSPNYMSPEQLRSARDVDHRTDIWALGVILQELLTGQVPWLAETVTQLTAKVLEDPPVAVTELRPDVPAALAQAIAKCLEKKREDRHQTVAEFAQAIAPFASPDGQVKANEMLSPVSGRTSGHERVAASPEPISFRVVKEGSSTHSAWDRTQLAPGKPGRRGMIFGGAIAVVAVACGLGFFLSRHKHETGPDPKPPPVAATAPVETTPEIKPAIATTVPPLLGTPSVTSPSVTAPTIHPPSTGTIHSKPDAGTIHAPPAADAGVAPTGTFQLPNVRN